jgi:hypothetical protein
LKRRSREQTFSRAASFHRANRVACAVAWLAEKSGRRIDLDRIWNAQRLPPALGEAVKPVCKEAFPRSLGGVYRSTTRE